MTRVDAAEHAARAKALIAQARAWDTRRPADDFAALLDMIEADTAAAVAAMPPDALSALAEARPYVYNQTQEPGWRGETARDVLARVDAALSPDRKDAP